MDVRAIASNLPSIAETSPATQTGGSSFSRIVDQVLESVNGPQREADLAVRDMVLGKTDQLHQILLSVAKADLAFRMMLEVRNRLTEAWQEVQRMQV